MTALRKPLAWAAAGAVLVMVLVAAWPTPGEAASRFTVSGSTSGLYPGATAPLTVTVTNGETRPITVTEVKAQIQSPSRDCAAKWFTVSAYSGRQVVAAQGTATIPLTASLAARAPSACSARSATVTYQAKATLG